MTFQRSGEVGGGAKWIQPPPQLYIAYHNPITQPSTQHYPLLEHANSYSAKYGPRCRAQGYPKGYHPVVLVNRLEEAERQMGGLVQEHYSIRVRLVRGQPEEFLWAEGVPFRPFGRATAAMWVTATVWAYCTLVDGFRAAPRDRFAATETKASRVDTLKNVRMTHW
jgi:hypothetical protein